MIANSTVGATSVRTVSVCICTFRRPALLRRSLAELAKQDPGATLKYHIVVADNDARESARQAVTDFAANSQVPTVYCVEPQEHNIALARNRALQHAKGDFIAFIDDDEFPAPDWLRNMVQTCDRHGIDGVLGPVRPFFDEPPPQWLVRGRFCDRPEHTTGTLLQWRQTRTGNVLFKRELLAGIREPFRREFGNGGEDQDFFRRMMQNGRGFIWCNEAVVYEVVPAERLKRTYMLKRALQRGQNEKNLLNAPSLAKSLAAVPIYSLILPFTLIFGQHRFMSTSIRLLDHAGKLLAALGVRPLGSKYLGR